MRKSDIDTFNTLVKTMNQNSGNIYRSSGWAVDILGNTVSGSEIDWTFAEGASYSMRVYMDDVNVSYDKVSDIDQIMG